MTQEAIRLSKAGLWTWRVEDELLAEGVFGDQLGFASEKVSRRGDRYRIASGLREMKESPFESRNEGAEQLDE